MINYSMMTHTDIGLQQVSDVTCHTIQLISEYDHV